MEQRPLRLGDTLDDYCPRERRVTNHAIVAMVEDGIKQTRCTTCDAEHAYKGGHAPRRRKKDSQAALYKEVLAGLGEPETVSGLTPVVPPVALPAPVAAPMSDMTSPEYAAAPPSDDREEDDAARADVPDEPAGEVEEGPVHRPLIRATLPRIEGQKEERRAPDFTIRQAGSRGPATFRGGGAGTRGKPRVGGGGGGEANGNRAGQAGHGGPRFSAGRPGGRGPTGRGGQSPSFRGGAPRHGGGKKRSR